MATEPTGRTFEQLTWRNNIGDFYAWMDRHCPGLRESAAWQEQERAFRAAYEADLAADLARLRAVLTGRSSCPSG